MGKELLNMDLESGLMTGALPLPQMEDSPFFPFPLVPPAVSVAGLGAQAAFTGESEPLKKAASLLTPAGIAGYRAYKTLAPKFAKYNQRTPDGKIPLFSETGAQVASYTPFQLAARAMGFRSNDVD